MRRFVERTLTKPGVREGARLAVRDELTGVVHEARVGEHGPDEVVHAQIIARLGPGEYTSGWTVEV